MEQGETIPPPSNPGEFISMQSPDTQRYWKSSLESPKVAQIWHSDRINGREVGVSQGVADALPGLIFKSFALSWYKNRLTDGQLLLNPQDTHMVYSILFKHNPLALISNRVRVPDGITIDTSPDGKYTISGIIAVSIADRKSTSFQRRMSSRLMWKELLEKISGPDSVEAGEIFAGLSKTHPEIKFPLIAKPGGIGLTLIMPKEASRNQDTGGSTRVLYAPATRAEIKTFAKSLIESAGTGKKS